MAGESYHKIIDLQSSLVKLMGGSIPLMMPLFNKDETALPRLKTEDGRSVSYVDTVQSRIWLDDLLQMRKE